MSAPRSPANVAAELIEGGNFLTVDSGTVYRYTGTFWEPLSDAALQNLALIADGQRRSSGRRRSEIIGQIKAASFRSGHRWGRVADWEIPCNNVVVDVRTGAVRPHRREDFLEKVLPWDYEPGAECPRWERALEEYFPGDQRDEPAALQEFAGYVALPHARFKKALVLYSLDSDTGKSVLPFLLMHLVGQAQTCSLPVDKMDDPIARAVLVGKQLNVVSELPIERALADDGFKALVSTEEPVFINQKFLPAFMYVPTAKHVFATNALPRMSAAVENILPRLLIVPFTRVFAGEDKDERLQEQLLKEMPGILLWAIAGAKRLVERRGRFVPPVSAAVLFAEMRNDANPAIAFMRERLIVDGDGKSAIPLARLVDVFNRWHKGSRRTTVKGLGRMFRAARAIVKEVRYPPKADRRHQKVVTCLLGFEYDDSEIPASIEVSGDALTSAAPEVEAK